jgi:hypothetical protein
MKKIFLPLMMTSLIIGAGLILMSLIDTANAFFHGFLIVGICILLGVAVKIMDELIDEASFKPYRIWIIPLALFIPTSMVYLALTEGPVIGMVLGTIIGILIAGKLDHPAYIGSVLLFIVLVLIAYVSQVIQIEITTLYIIPVAAAGSFLDEFGHEKWTSANKTITFLFKHRFFLKIFAFFGVVLGFALPIHLIGFLCFDVFYDLVAVASSHDLSHNKSPQMSPFTGAQGGVNHG